MFAAIYRKWEETISRRRVQRCLLALLAIGLTTWGLTGIPRCAVVDSEHPQDHVTDVTVYTEAARAFFDGRDPYEVTNVRGWRYIYPPLFALLISPLALLSPSGQAIAWFFISLLFGWGCWRETCRLFDLLPGDERHSSAKLTWPSWLPWLAVCAVAGPAIQALALGQVGILLVYLLLLGFRLVLQGQTVQESARGGVALALAVVVKLTPAMPVGLLVLMLFCLAAAGRWSGEPLRRAIGCSLGLAGAMVLFLLLLPSMAIGPEANAHHLRTWVAWVTNNAGTVTSINRVKVHSLDDQCNAQGVSNQSLANSVRLLGMWGTGGQSAVSHRPLSARELGGALDPTPMDGPFARGTVLAARLLLVALLLAAGGVVGLRGDRLGTAAAFGLACALTAVVSPLAWKHHFVFLFPAVLLLPHWHWRNGSTRWALSLAVSAVAMMAVFYAALDRLGQLGFLGLATSAWCLVGTFSLFFRGRRAVIESAVLERIPEPLAVRQAA